MKRYIILFLLLSILHRCYSQNIISNPGFESGNFDVSLFSYERLKHGLQSWEGRYKVPWWSIFNENNYTTNWHSPDWFGMINSNPQYLHSDAYYVYAPEGNKYVGMMDYEFNRTKTTSK